MICQSLRIRNFLKTKPKITIERIPQPGSAKLTRFTVRPDIA